jgi:hypothetical protein
MRHALRAFFGAKLGKIPTALPVPMRFRTGWRQPPHFAGYINVRFSYVVVRLLVENFVERELRHVRGG